ncbi:MAG TPA: hypothetical protein VFY43_05275 [Candidatus Limnocylindria bacterium]|nr:hypothetical protein [Candidatus Limnocylindria bacterium]
MTVVVPVNAQVDLATAKRLLDDLQPWVINTAGRVLLVINNFTGEEPSEVDELRARGATVILEQSLVVRHGEVPPIAARAIGAREAGSGFLVHLDADVRVPDAPALMNWYLQQYVGGIRVAATTVEFHEVPPGVSIRARIAAHRLARWVKRVILRTPVTRGSNYATDRDLFLMAYERGMIADELNVGPALVALGARYAYSGDPSLRVLTSARRLRGGWVRLVRYLAYRFAYNVRALPVDDRAADRTRRSRDPQGRWQRPD